MQTNAAESLKLKQARAKANRDRQRARIDPRHKYLFSIVADRLQLEADAVEEFMLDGDQVRKWCYSTHFVVLYGGRMPRSLDGPV